MASTPTRYFAPGLFSFLRDLADNNNRAWFQDNHDRYEDLGRGPARAFIADLAEPLHAISPHFTAEPRLVGGSLFRIQRDTRFTRDKTPYRTHIGLQFRHAASGDDMAAPAFYLHLEPRNCFAALGLHRPPAPRAQAVRLAIAARPQAWIRATRRPPFSAVYTMDDGDLLHRPPPGFAPDHPLLDDLRRRDFTASTRLTQDRVTGPRFLDDYAATLRAGAPLARFLCEALGLPF